MAQTLLRPVRIANKKVARASRPCVSTAGDTLAGTHGRDARATTLPALVAQVLQKIFDERLHR